VTTASRSDADRLGSGELVYVGVVRTPLCALAHQVPWAGRSLNVMKEFFGTTADVYRLTGELDPAHDLYPAADNAAKDALGSRRRIARLIGLDARDGSDADWLQFAHAWRTAQVTLIAEQLRRVRELHRLPADAVAVSAGCGDFLADEAWHAAGGHGDSRRFGDGIARAVDVAAARAAQVCAPSVAVAALLHRETD
jgi:probable H4MPT-linked C1 transfer pathway protein